MEKNTAKKFHIDKTFKTNLITYSIVIAAFIIVQILISAGQVSSLMKGLLVPLCIYQHYGDFLESDCWYSGRAQPWPCRFYVYGSLCQLYLFHLHDGFHTQCRRSFFLCNSSGRSSRCRCRYCCGNPCFKAQRRLSGNCNTGLLRNYQECCECTLS